MDARTLKLTQPRARNFERTNHHQTNLELQPRRASWLGVQRLVLAMQYSGELFGKVGRRYVPLKMHSDVVDALEKERDELKEALTRLDSIYRNDLDAVPRRPEWLAKHLS